VVDQLLVTRGGLFSTLQDFGRFGYQRFGISASGAMDTVAMRIANALVGNAPGTAVVEMTMLGLAATVDAAGCRVAVAGGDFQTSLNGRPAEAWRSYDLVRGDRLEIGAARAGMRGYLAVAGGFALAPTLGSLSTHSRSGIGGLDGRALQAGDRLPLAHPAVSGPLLLLDAEHRPRTDGPIRVVLGPQQDAFTPAGVETFLASAYRVTEKADRMGCRLDGPKIEHARGFNIVSDGIMNGSIQVPGQGTPIVLLADRQSTGGYPKIATVIGPDLHRLGQRRPGDEVRFARVTIEEAEAIAAAHRAAMLAIPSTLRPVVTQAAGLSSERLLSANLVSGVVSA
jgi:biotin-dependent carboxylase-like uncharacterized protein